MISKLKELKYLHLDISDNNDISDINIFLEVVGNMPQLICLNLNFKETFISDYSI